MSGFIHMQFSDVNDATKGVADSGAQLQSDWQTTGNLTINDEGAIGFDKLGMAFLRGYGGPAQRLRETGAAMPNQYFDLADVGQTCMGMYDAADQTSAQCFAD